MAYGKYRKRDDRRLSDRDFKSNHIKHHINLWLASKAVKIVGLLLLFSIIFISFLYVNAEDLTEQYNALLSARMNSKDNYNKKLFFLREYIDDGGKLSVELQEGIADGDVNNPVEESSTTNDVDTQLAEGLQQNAMNFYKKATLKQSTQTRVVNGITVYDGSPWSLTNAYELDITKVEEYLQKYLGQDLGQAIVSDSNCKATTFQVDGVNVVDFAGYPILSFLDIDSNGNSLGWSKSTRPRKALCVLIDSTGKFWYLPVGSASRTPGNGDGDAKGHVWPGGVAQTFLSSTSGNGTWRFNTDNGTITGDIIGRDITSLSDILKGYSSVEYKGTPIVKYNNPQMNLEVNSRIGSSLSGVFKIVTFISWKE